MQQVTWMWFGNLSQLNVDPATPVTLQELQPLVGHSATGQAQIKPVLLSGTPTTGTINGVQTQVFRTSYNWYTTPATATALHYVSPSEGGEVSKIITSFASVTYALTLPDGTIRKETGVLMQMSNGDIFFRPARDTVPAWEDIAGLQSVEIRDATPLGPEVFVALVSFSPTIFDLRIKCFCAGTLIRTATGERPVEELRPGDLVMTRDHGLQPLRWCGVSTLSRAELDALPHLRPVRIDAGALGPDTPSLPLRLSPQHRVLVSSSIAARMFGARELLVPVIQLTELPGVAVEDAADGVSYHHLLFDRHEVVLSNGAATESLYTGPEALRALSPDAIAEIETLFPQLTLGDAPPAARHLVRGPRVRRMVQRHMVNQRPLFS